MGESILHNAGLPEWIATDEADYAVRGTRLASDLGALAALREGLRPRMLASPLFDAPRFARNLEGAFRGMWATWCAAQRRA
jgi:predicted O-linked N-acetylglucosamine transferase (SPINDLY family)